MTRQRPGFAAPDLLAVAVTAVIVGWGSCPALPAHCVGDANGDGEVNVTDLVAVVENWTT